jgi:hypothetical protein
MRVCVYRNLNAKTAAEQWSVATVSGRRGKGTKLGGVASIALANVEMVIQPAAAARIASGENRSVHAWFVGDVVAMPAAATARCVEIAYNPKKRPQWLYFHTAEGARVDSALYVELTIDGRAYAAGIR